MGINGNSMTRKLFGTDGIRGTANALPMTSEIALKVGMAGDLFVETQTAVNAVALPRDALVYDNGIPIAYVVHNGETFLRRELTLGVTDGQYVQVTITEARTLTPFQISWVTHGQPLLSVPWICRCRTS